MKSLIIITLLIIFFEINAQDNECFEYRIISDIGDCLTKKTGRPHYGCCGLNITRENKSHPSCLTVGNTRASREAVQKAQEMAAKETNRTFDLKCSNQEDEIKGNCEEFLGVMVVDP